MPTFTVNCKSCDHTTEMFCSHKTASEAKCEKCESETQIIIQATSYRYGGIEYANPIHNIKKSVISKSVGRFVPGKGVIDDGGE